MKISVGIIIFFSVLMLISCKPKETIIPDTYQETQEKIEINNNETAIKEQILYVGSFDGLNLREEYGLTGRKIRTLPQYTKLLILEKSNHFDNIDGLTDCWYKVEAGDDVGWVFGAYLISNPGEKVSLDKPVLLMKDESAIKNESAVLEFPDSRIERASPWGGKCYLCDIDTIKIYDSTNKEAHFSEVVNASVMLFKLPETEDWLYLVTEDLKNHGFIFIYDISERSFYGDFEENEESFNYYRTRLIKEYEILKKHQNIKRYGPLLEIYYNHNVLKLWDSFTGDRSGGHLYLLRDYYEEYDEALIYKQYYEGGDYFIYSLPLGDFICEIGGVPIFNQSRDTAFSLADLYSDPGVIFRGFLIKNGVYEKIKEETLIFNFSLKINGYWKNDNEFQIDYKSPSWDESRQETGVVLTAKRTSPDANFEFIKLVQTE